MIIGKVKTYALMALAGIATILAFVVKYLNGRAQRLEHKADQYKAQARQAAKVDEAETEIESEYSDAEREAKRDIEEGRMPDSLRNRNRVRDD